MLEISPKSHIMSNKFKLGIAGNQWITSFLINKLVSKKIIPNLIINMDKDWEEKISGYFDLKEQAKLLDIDIYRPKQYNLKSQEDEFFLTKYNLDILIVFGWQRLIPDWFIDNLKFGVWGVHGGPERPPRCRGQAVFNWSLILGYQKFYMYLFEITPGVDEGEIAEMREFDILETDDVLTLYHKNCIVSSEMFIKNIPLIVSNEIHLKSQDKSVKATYLPKRKPENGGINWLWDAKKITNFVRALAPPYPGAFTELNSNIIYIYVAHIFDTKLKFNVEPGEIIEIFQNRDFIVMSKDLPIYVRSWECKNDIKLKTKEKFNLSSGIELQDPEI